MLTAQFEPKPSRLLGGMLLAMVALALFSITLIAMPLKFKGALSAAVLVGIGRWIWLQRRPFPCIRLEADGTIHVRAGESAWQRAEVLPESFVAPGWCVVRLKAANARQMTLTLLPDSAPADDLRKLRVLLRWGHHTRLDTANPDAG